MMKTFTIAAFLLVLPAALARPAFAQLPGEPKPPGNVYDPVRDMQYDFQRWAPSETVREVQQVLRDQGYYDGPLDGVLNPQFRRAIANFQRAKELPRTAHLDGRTMAALDLPATGAASPGSAPSFGASPGPSHLNDVETP
jgi:peptidoglycan hydrolase-like protein with peptidoglycan-binding domain